MWQRRAAASPARDRPAHPALVVSIGLAVGLLTGVVGIGGGFLIVPALVIGGGLPMRSATSASLLVIALSTAAGLAGYLGRAAFDWPVVGVFAVVASGGAIAGGLLAGRVSVQRLQQAFAVLLLALAVYILVRG